MYVRMYVCMYIYIYICMCVCVCTHVSRHARWSLVTKQLLQIENKPTQTTRQCECEPFVLTPCALRKGKH